MDKCRKMKGAKWIESLTDITRKGNRRCTNWNGTGHNGMNGWTMTMPTTTLQSDLRLRALRRWHVVQKREMFFFYFVFVYFFFSSFSFFKLLQGLLTA